MVEATKNVYKYFNYSNIQIENNAVWWEVYAYYETGNVASENKGRFAFRGFYFGIVGRGGALVETITFNRRVVGSTPALAAT